MEVINYKGNVDFLEPIAYAWLDEAHTKDFGLNAIWDKFKVSLQELADGPESVLLLLADDGKAVGFLGGVLFESPLDSQQIANEHFWYVIPKYRGRPVFKLMKAFRRWAREKGASHLMMNASMLASDKHDRMCKLYAKNMKHFETTYLQEL